MMRKVHLCWTLLPALGGALALLGAKAAIERGMEAFRERRFADAERAFQQAVREQPASARAHKWLGMTFVAREQYARAEEPFQKACGLDSREENACYYLGKVYYELNRYQEALKAFDKAMQDTGERGRPLLGSALALESLGRIADAERAFRQAIGTGDRQARVDYGLFLFRQGRTTESVAELRAAHATAELDKVTRAIESMPGNAARSSAPTQIRFESRTLDMVLRNGATGEKHQIETMAGGVAMFDYDNDGWPDIYVANGARIPSLVKDNSGFWNRLFRNNRDGTFADVTESAGVQGEGYSIGVAAADYDNDGWVDLFVTGVRGNTLYRNRGDGTFEDATARAGVRGDGQWAVAAGWFDYDNDGLLDLFVVRYVAWDPAREIYCGLPKPGYRTYCHPQHYQPLANVLYHNEGGGRFRDVSRESGIAAHTGKGMGVAFGDYDGDGRLDVFVANDTVPNFLFRNQGDGRFQEAALTAGVAYNSDGKANSWMGADFRDFDNDGREDIFVTALTNESWSLYRNIGRGSFADIAGPSRIAAGSLRWSGWSAGMFDFNNDGLKDVFAAGGHVMDNAELTSGSKSRQPNVVFANRGDGTFDSVALPGEALDRGAAFGDFDRDGRIDVVVTRLNEQPIVLRNVSPAKGHWLALRLVGTRSNRDGIGALVRITTASGHQWNRVTTSVGYASSSDRIVHFGLGRDNMIQAVEIAWPSGKRQELRNVMADRYLEVREPE